MLALITRRKSAVHFLCVCVRLRQISLAIEIFHDIYRIFVVMHVHWMFADLSAIPCNSFIETTKFIFVCIYGKKFHYMLCKLQIYGRNETFSRVDTFYYSREQKTTKLWREKKKHGIQGKINKWIPKLSYYCNICKGEIKFLHVKIP